MSRLCCIDLTLAARIIGIFDLLTSISAIYILMKRILSHENGIFLFLDIKILLGLGWVHTSQADWISVCFLVYSIIQFLCSASLILGTIFKIKSYATPWLTFEVINLAQQANIVFSRHLECRCHGERVTQSTFLADGIFCLCACFWLVVCRAQKLWTKS